MTSKWEARGEGGVTNDGGTAESNCNERGLDDEREGKNEME